MAARRGGANEVLRSPELLEPTGSRLLIVDVQEKLLPAIPESRRLIANCSRLIRAAAIFDVAVSATEQYPKGLGHTVKPLSDLLPPAIEKTTFSSVPVLDWCRADPVEIAPHTVVVAGIEAHVCVLQTVFDLIARGFRVSVVADAIASRHLQDETIALQRMLSGGAVITTLESVLFEWCQRSGTPEFKKISALVKEGCP